MNALQQSALGIALLSSLLFVVSDAMAQDRARYGTFPAIEANDLNGDEIVFPDDLRPEGSLLILGFSEKLRDDFEEWKEALTPLTMPPVSLHILYLPVIQDPGAFIRLFIDGGMRAGTKESQRKNSATLYPKDADEFKRQLRISGDTIEHVMLVDNSGKIIWYHRGAATPQTLQDLREAALAARREAG